ncbi:hypothetical protein BD310DRAFT_302047 [Dichomitus squalens]|uniref:Uncharacterized protein n=1 Tax=Dichomitus squalens TaxID=114155 RepID=A0A4Q9QBM1_9APHY|nr:hypothetical protein BD310DRAFT_302047 [Dichomitus squalens]
MLLQTLAERCNAILDEAARAAEWGVAPTAAVSDTPQSAGGASGSATMTREHLLQTETESDLILQFLAERPPHDAHLCVVRLKQDLGALRWSRLRYWSAVPRGGGKRRANTFPSPSCQLLRYGSASARAQAGRINNLSASSLRVSIDVASHPHHIVAARIATVGECTT